MPDHTCPHAQDIGAMKKTLKKVDDAVSGNGKDGLILKVDRIEHTVETMQEDLATIARSTSAFAKSQIEGDAIEKERNRIHKQRSKSLEKIGIFATLVFGAVGLLYVILEHTTG